jgi:hypothetical protein
VGKFLTLGAGWLLFVACGGQSIAPDDDSGAGRGSAAGSGGTGKAGSSGKSAGGAGGRAGGSSPSAGAGSTGVAGTGSAGMSSAGTSSAGTGAAGTGSVPRCQQPLETGSCNAYFPKYGFNPTNRYCQRFIYGGCGGNDNSFDTLSECEATCGGSDQGNCPEVRPDPGTACELPSDDVCYYNEYNCQCAATADGCLPIDLHCPALPTDAPDAGDGCADPDCTARIVLPIFYRCSCSSSGWSCGTFDGRPER